MRGTCWCFALTRERVGWRELGVRHIQVVWERVMYRCYESTMSIIEITTTSDTNNKIHVKNGR